MRKLVRGVLVVLFMLAILIAHLYVAGHPERPQPAQYVAMGSSYSSGPGITHRAAQSPWFCFRSDDNYAHQLARKRGLSLVDMTCGGASTPHILEGGQVMQPAQLDGLTTETQLVTLTIGGNDISFVGNLVAYGCDSATSPLWKTLKALGRCKPMPQSEVEKHLQELPDRFDRIVAQVHQRSPQARLVLLTYQTVLPPTGSCAKLGLSDAQADIMRKTAADLAAVTRDAAARNHVELFDAGAATQGHDVCAQDPWMTDHFSAVALHPTLGGMTAIAQGLDQMLGSVAHEPGKSPSP